MPSAVPTSEIIAYLDELLGAPGFPDFGPNGLQVPGQERVERVVTGVSAHADLLRAAAEARADLVLVHHGLFWKGQPLEITPILHARLKLLYGGGMALAAYHLPLDAHPEHGNNALLAGALGAVDQQPFARESGRAIGVRARFDGDGIETSELVARVREAVGGREPLVVTGGPERVRTIGIVTGGGTDYVHDAITEGLDAFVTGEPAERAFGIARDGAITFLAAGHHATETFGVRRLGELLERELGVEHRFIDIENPI